MDGDNWPQARTGGGIDVTQTEWEWPMTDCLENHGERAALLRPIVYEMTSPVDSQGTSTREGKALSINISSGGMLLLMDQASPTTILLI